MKYKNQMCVDLFRCLDKGNCVGEFCKEVNISMSTFDRWIKTKIDFKNAYEVAKMAQKLYWTKKLKKE